MVLEVSIKKCHVISDTSLKLETKGKEEDFTKPSPLSGYFIALASLVCLVFMLYDIFVAIRHRKYWFPCSLFPLGSFTVSLVTVATQITNDQTTIMPTALDQLSKLTGTAMICICMGFFMPSLGTMRIFECLSNMASWSVLVITAIVNIFQQISSGMVFVPLFIVEHAIIIFSLVVLIPVLSYCSIQVFHEKEMAADLHADLLMKTSGSMFKRLRYCYVYGYISNPQLILCRSPLSTTVGMLCSLCSLVAIEAGVRSLFLRSGEPCEVASKYESSLTMVVVIQILFVLVGGLAVLIRVFTFALDINLESSRDNLTAEREHLRLQFIFYNGNIVEVLVRIVIVLVLFGVVCSNRLIWLPARILTLVVQSMRTFLIAVGVMKDKNIEEMKNVLKTHGIEAAEWILRKGQGDCERWVKLNVRNSVNHLEAFLSSNHEPYQELSIEDQELSFEEKIRSISPSYKVSCLSLVILAKFAASAFPNDKSIVQTLDEVFQIIYFIDKKTFEANPENRRKLNFTKVWLGGKCSRNINSCLDIGGLSVDAKELRSKLKDKSRFLFVCHEVEVIQQLIKSHNPKQVLAYMLRIFLAKLPIAIHEDVTQSQPEQYEKRVKVAIKFLCKLKPVKDQIQWEFPPAETEFTSLVDDS